MSDSGSRVFIQGQTRVLESEEANTTPVRTNVHQGPSPTCGSVASPRSLPYPPANVHRTTMRKPLCIEPCSLNSMGTRKSPKRPRPPVLSVLLTTDHTINVVISSEPKFNRCNPKHDHNSEQQLCCPARLKPSPEPQHQTQNHISSTNIPRTKECELYLRRQNVAYPVIFKAVDLTAMLHIKGKKELNEGSQ